MKLAIISFTAAGKDLVFAYLRRLLKIPACSLPQISWQMKLSPLMELT